MFVSVTAGWLLLAAVLARADDPPKPPATPADQVKALQKEYDDARAAFQKAYSQAKTDEERNKAIQEKYPKPEALAGKFLEVAEKNPADPAAVDALVWVVQNSRQPGADSPAGKALRLLQKDHLANPKVGPVCLVLSYNYDPAVVPFLRAVLEKNPSRDVQAAACLTLAQVLKTRAEMARSIKEKPANAERYVGFLGKETVAELKAKAPAEFAAESERLFERVVKDYADVKTGRGTNTYGTAAAGELFEIRHLAIGKAAPEITGEDIDGLPLRLSDFRGKVVVLDFWGHW